ncbi:MAG: hypothetical protein RIB59_05790 [Rhodospirillales bacterium]
MRVIVDILHPFLALHLLATMPRHCEIFFAFRTKGILTSLMLFLLRCKVGCCKQYDYCFSDPDDRSAKLYHLFQEKITATALHLRKVISTSLTRHSDEPESCWRRIMGVLLNEMIQELWFPVQITLVAAKDINTPTCLYLNRTRFDKFISDSKIVPWNDLAPGSMKIRRHRVLWPWRTCDRTEYWVSGCVEKPLRPNIIGVARTLTLTLFGCLREFFGRRVINHSPPPSERPLIAFFLEPEMNNLFTGMGWLSDMSPAPTALIPAGLPSSLAGFPHLRFAEAIPYSLGRQIMAVPAKFWRGYHRWLKHLYRQKPICSLPKPLAAWFWQHWLELKRREAFFAATFEARSTRLVWMACQFFAINATAAASAILRLGGSCWGGCNSLHNTVDSFVFRNNAERVFTWGARDVEILKDSNAIEIVEAAGYPMDLTRYKVSGHSLRNDILKRGFHKIIAVYDNKHAKDLMIDEDNLVDLFEAILDAADRAPGTFIIVKTKALELFDTVRLKNILDRLISNSRVLIDQERSNIAPVFAADVAVGIMLSGPCFIAASSGIPAISLDPSGYTKLPYAPNISTFHFVSNKKELTESILTALQASALTPSAIERDSLMVGGADSPFNTRLHRAATVYLACDSKVHAA